MWQSPYSGNKVRQVAEASLRLVGFAHQLADCNVEDTADRHEFGMADRFEGSTRTCTPPQVHNWLKESSHSTVMRERAKDSAKID